jgi:hypothetical protein
LPDPAQWQSHVTQLAHGARHHSEDHPVRKELS